MEKEEMNMQKKELRKLKRNLKFEKPGFSFDHDFDSLFRIVFYKLPII